MNNEEHRPSGTAAAATPGRHAHFACFDSKRLVVEIPCGVWDMPQLRMWTEWKTTRK
jgi:hypothetical protein